MNSKNINGEEVDLDNSQAIANSLLSDIEESISRIRNQFGTFLDSVTVKHLEEILRAVQEASEKLSSLANEGKNK